MSLKNKKYRRVVIKEEYLALTGDAFQAAILDRFVELTYQHQEYDKWILAEKARAASAGKSLDISVTDGWVYKKAEELTSEIMIIDSPKTVRKKLGELIEKGYLMEKNSDEYRFERTKQYKANIEVIIRDLESIGYSFDSAVGM